MLGLLDKILKYIKELDHVSFQELSREIKGFSGEFPMPLPDYENIIIWHSLSQEAGKALIELLIAEDIFVHPFDSKFATLEGGEFPSYPIAASLKNFKTTHWFPMTLSCKP
ncbi:MAG: hypothetical protein GQ583_02555 [Methyloprofundus sp.]|nr:hypothetical protein [Methyloprofundus sp.]